MAIEKLSIAFDLEIAEEARRRAGPRGLSRFVNAAVRQYLQALRLGQVWSGKGSQAAALGGD